MKKPLKIMFFTIMSFLLLIGTIQPNSTFGESPSVDNQQITPDQGPPLNKLWNQSVGSAAGTPAVVDITNDGDYEIVAGGSNGIFVFNDAGNILWNDSSFGTPEVTPVLADVDDDNRLELFISTYNHVLVAFNAEDGTVLWNQTLDDDGVIGNSLTDLDKDGNYELIVNAYGHFHLFDALTGQAYWSSDFNLDGTIFQTAVGDLDNDGLDEIIIGGFSELRAVDTNGIMMWNASVNLQSGAALADLDMDGFLDVIVGTADGYLKAFRGDNGTLLWSSALIKGAIISTPSIGDLDNDGYFEISIGASYSNTTYVFNHDGTLSWSYHHEGWATASATLADVDGDDELELITNDYQGNLYALEGNGSLLWHFRPADISNNDVGSPIVFDLDQDGDFEFIDLDGWDKGSSNLVVYDMGTTGDKVAWYGLRGTDESYSLMNVAYIDADSDTLTDREELELGTDPNNPDTDGDGIPDGVEAKLGADPVESEVRPTESNNSEEASDDGFFSDLPGFNLLTSIVTISSIVITTGLMRKTKD